ncbi:hypothetical protein [Flavobacterium sp. RSSB_23]|uniref:hypothetical protein n=1 Tax=Flavobacterium sp. RSSB_23 TaxID=3447668 RepID=UPI003F4066BB
MKRIFIAILTITILTNCNNSNNKPVDNSDRLELVPESDKEIREENEKQKEKQLSCTFSEPDTSVVGIKIRNAESILNILGEKTKLEGDSTYILYSNDKKQKLELTIHPGESYNQVSIFNISYTYKSNLKLRQIKSKEFETEKGIKLGISKRQIIEKLGNCYIVKDSSKNSIELNYRLELPNDSKTKILKTNNLPIYYASYKLTNDKLESIEFGFEYP